MSPATISSHLLTPHPATPRGGVERLHVEVSRDGPDRLRLSFQLHGDIGALALPEPAPAVHTDGLWRHTCFEAFLAPVATTGYREFNFSPSGAWASYLFTGYRAGMAPAEVAAVPVIEFMRGTTSLTLRVTLELGGLARPPHSALRLGLSAVIEERSRGLSYWALEHAADKPDFHRPESFVVTLA